MRVMVPMPTSTPQHNTRGLALALIPKCTMSSASPDASEPGGKFQSYARVQESGGEGAVVSEEGTSARVLILLCALLGLTRTKGINETMTGKQTTTDRQ
jgi:hypothetical protein